MKSALLLTITLLINYLSHAQYFPDQYMENTTSTMVRLPMVTPPHNWQYLDKDKDAFQGISLDKAYSELLLHKKSQTVLVAILDNGIDTLQKDLRSILWNNPKEIPGNGKDDDGNGYVDDVHGWNFIGGPHGDVKYDNTELVRILRKEQPFYDSLSKNNLLERDRNGYQRYQQLWSDYNDRLSHAKSTLEAMKKLEAILLQFYKDIGKEKPAAADFEQLTTTTTEEEFVRQLVITRLPAYPDFGHMLARQRQNVLNSEAIVDSQLNLSFDPRPVVGDHYSNLDEKYYGNNNITGTDPQSGTAVAGIIGAQRGNDGVVAGVADNVRILPIRILPEGDERDKDVANGIRYAVDNGAKVINLSFEKEFSPYRNAVDEAVRYAMSRDVLIVHSAGDNSKNLDSTDNFPTRKYEKGGEATAWIEVGGSLARYDSAMVIASTSNYGKRSVDVLAPAEEIYTTLPGLKYGNWQGSRAAAAVVTGLAALIREYYPSLSASQVKDVILQSVTLINQPCPVKNVSGQWMIIPFSQSCGSGGVVNAYKALLLAEQITIKK